MTSKQCSACGENKDLSLFSPNKGLRGGVQCRCKLCCSLELQIKRLQSKILGRLKGDRDDEIKKCLSCGEIKNNSDFGARPSSRDGRNSSCLSCVRRRNREKSAEFRRSSPDRFKESKLSSGLAKYGLTTSQYEEMSKLCEGKCQICGRQENSRRFTRLSVDHSHKTGEVRGLLCSRCNTAIGLLGDDTSVLARAIEYLKNGDGKCQSK